MSRTASVIRAIGTALPDHVLDASARGELLQSIWPRMAMVGAAMAESGGLRYLAEDPKRLLEPRGLTDAMALYGSHAIRLAESASRQALDQAGINPAAIDVIVSVSCTGYLVPALDVHLIERLGMRPDVVRLPITELGCSGGAAAISLGHRHLVAYPDQCVLVVAVELAEDARQPLPFLRQETRVLPVAKTAVGLGGTPVPPERIVIENVVVNAKLDDALFSKPQITASTSNSK